MKSICIKTNNENILNYIKSLLNTINEQQICFSINTFKLYKNIIIHYTGQNSKLFYTKLSKLLSYVVINKFELRILKRIIFSNYFYFDNSEREKILDTCVNFLSNKADFTAENRQEFLFESFYNYISLNKQLVLDGFINFRLKNYTNYLESVVDTAVNKLIIEREYYEFISLLKLYINSNPTNSNFVHLVCSDDELILLDENKNIINLKSDVFETKYLSDISFSSNDYILNALLTILPKKIYVHLINNTTNEFINTLKLIFDGKLEFCQGCTICKIYKNKPKESSLK